MKLNVAVAVEKIDMGGDKLIISFGVFSTESCRNEGWGSFEWKRKISMSIWITGATSRVAKSLRTSTASVEGPSAGPVFPRVIGVTVIGKTSKWPSEKIRESF